MFVIFISIITSTITTPSRKPKEGPREDYTIMNVIMATQRPATLLYLLHNHTHYDNITRHFNMFLCNTLLCTRSNNNIYNNNNINNKDINIPLYTLNILFNTIIIITTINYNNNIHIKASNTNMYTNSNLCLYNRSLPVLATLFPIGYYSYFYYYYYHCYFCYF